MERMEERIHHRRDVAKKYYEYMMELKKSEKNNEQDNKDQGSGK